MSRYIVDVLGVGSFRHDIYKQKLNEVKIKKCRSISTIYRLFTDISDTISVTNAARGTKCSFLQFWPIYRPKIHLDPTARIVGHVEDRNFVSKIQNLQRLHADLTVKIQSVLIQRSDFNHFDSNGYIFI